MPTQSEAILEHELINQLESFGYDRVNIRSEEELLQNLKNQLEEFNSSTLSAREFEAILNHLSKGNVFEKAKTLRDRFQLTNDNGEVFYISFFDSEKLDE